MGNGLDVTVGALLLATMLTTMGFGVTSMQTYLWWRHYPRDPLQIRLVVWSLLCLDICHIILSIHMIYYYLVINYNSPEALTKSVWSFDITVVVTATITLISHCFYARRVYILSNHNYWLPAVIILLSGVRLAFGCVVTARMFQIQVLDKLPDAMAPYVGTGMGSGSIADCIITASLVYYLRDHKTGFNSRTDSLLDKLTYWTVNCGLLPSVVGVAVIVCFIIMPDNMIYLALHLLLSKLYANALLATLNFRKAHRGRGVTDEESSIPLSSMRAGEGDRSFSKRDSSAVAPVVHVMTTTITDAPDADGDKKPTPLDYHFTHAIVDDVSDMGTYKRDQDRV